VKEEKLEEYFNLICLKGEEIANTSSAIVLSPKRNSFFGNLQGYLKFHAELKAALLKHYQKDSSMLERIKQIPYIHYENYSLSPITFFVLLISLPIGAIIFYMQMNYMKEVRKKVIQSVKIYTELIPFVKKQTT
jgi:hypothetical protein